MMATTAETRCIGLPRNKTGLFAADTIQEVKPAKGHLTTVPPLSPQYRHAGSVNLLLASAEQNYRQMQQCRLSNDEIHQYYPATNTAVTSNGSGNSHSKTQALRNGFRPSTVLHHPLKTTTRNVDSTSTHHDDRREILNSVTSQAGGKQGFIQSRASARLKCEIDEINSKLKRQNDLSKSIRFTTNREMDTSPPSVLSYSASCRLSSASTTQTADRIHQRFTSAFTNGTVNTHGSMAIASDSSEQQQAPDIAVPAIPSTIIETDNHHHHQRDVEYQPTHAYQIPQQSNVGMDSVVILDRPKAKSLSPNIAHQRNTNRSISCPFYIMYFTHLAMQQQQLHSQPETIPTAGSLPSATRKVPLNSRTSTAYTRRSQPKRRISTPSSANTYVTLFDDDIIPARTKPHGHHKLLSAKIAAFENENSHLLQDLLRTTSWNHVQV